MPRSDEPGCLDMLLIDLVAWGFILLAAVIVAESLGLRF